jgi:hypothetical protein
LVASLIRNDQLFRVSPDAGYALSWALTSYLVETQPLGYTRFVKATNEASQAGKRKVDPLLLFQEAFGPVNKVEGGLRSYVASLKID